MKTITKWVLSLVLVLSIIAGCADRSASPIQTIIPGDSQLDCEELIGEIGALDSRARKKLGQQSSKTGKNVGYGVTGAFLLVPLFFMDFSDAERIEAEALRDRYLHLQRLSRKKKCEF